MRLLLASVATLAAVALAAPVFAQDATPAAPAATSTPTPTPTPSTTTKHKPAAGTAAYCNTLKSSTSKSSCLKRVHAQNTTPKAGTTPAAHKKTKKPADTTKTDTSAAATPAPATGSSSPQTINVPPLPQKTI
jgi:hypothetical protein